ncbi:MAG TPA: VOC family protein [Verrucomicrobiae bacterium]|nr:VOC family protein [Verrucomicrobiae bacterium]
MKPDALKIHHLGVATADLAAAQTFYQETLGFALESGPFDDPIQKVRVCFLRRPGNDECVVELIMPLDPSSPVGGYLSKGLGAYHICYEVADLEEAQIELRSRKCLPVSAPVPAVAFGGRKIAWWFTPTKHLIEIVEADASAVG